MGGNRHDGTRAVTSEHIVADVNGNVFARDRIDGIAASEHAAHLLFNHALALGLVLHLIKVSVNSGTLVGGNHLVNIHALGRKYHEGHTEDGVGPGGENQQALVAVGNGEGHLGTLAVADPVALGLLD